MTDTAIETRELRMSFGTKTILDDIGLTVERGEVFSLLGPNGAGKTTMVNILSTLHAPDSGSAAVFGCDVVSDASRVRAMIGLTGQFSAVDGLLTGRENLEMMAAFAHLPRSEQKRRVDELLERFDLGSAAAKQTTKYSGGMRRRLDLAMTLIARPRLVFLDEPTTGLDPRSRKTMWDIVGELVGDGMSIFLTTQQLEEADALADRIALLDNGGIVADGTPAELKRRIPGGHVRVEFAHLGDLDRARRRLPDSLAEGEALNLVVPGDAGAEQVRGVLNALADDGIEPLSFAVETPSLDDVFFALTGHDVHTDKEARR